MKKKILKISLGFIAIFVIGFIVYAYQLHALAVKGNEIFAKRCTVVNPPLISYKNSFLQMADMLNNPENYEPGSGEAVFESYISGMREYFEKENEWLDEQRRYLNRQDFQLLEPWYIKQASEYQYKMYEGYRDEAKYMLATFDAGGWTEEINNKFTEARERRQQNKNLYFELFDEASQIRDWRKFFGSVPVPEECTEENTTIPATEGSINWSGTSTPTPMPVNPDLVS